MLCLFLFSFPGLLDPIPIPKFAGCRKSLRRVCLCVGMREMVPRDEVWLAGEGGTVLGSLKALSEGGRGG